MTKIIWATLMLAAGLIVMQSSCSKNAIGRTDYIPMLNPAKTDINAGSWKTILLTDPTEFNVAAPAAVTSTAYTAELNEIKALQNNLTKEQDTKIAY